MLWRIATGLAIAVICALLLAWLRSYPWELALLSGASLGTLVFVALQTAVRLKETLSQFRGPGPSD